MTADMMAWNSQVAQRFRVLLNIREISGDLGEQSADGEDQDGDKAKLKRAATARNENALDVRAVHDALATYAFSGYQDWCEYDDDDWLRNCLGQVLDDEQSRFLLTALESADLLGLTAAVKKMADTYVALWERAARDEFPDTALNFAENTESWKYSRTPGTRYYIFQGGKYLYSDDKEAPLADWASAEARDNEAASRATEWESGSGIYYTAYEYPEFVKGQTHVFGRSTDGPWVLTRSEAEQILIGARQSPAAAGVAAIGASVEPYFDTGHFTKYENDKYFFGATADAGSWFGTYQELLDSLAPPPAPAQEDDEEEDEDNLDELADALAELFDAVPEAADMPVDELYEAIMRGAQ